jgi:hypothetical protein
VDAKTGEPFQTIVGEEAHIYSASPDGPRYDPNYPAVKLETYENRILLCRNHHIFIDSESGRAYDAETLLEMKKRHEQLGEALRVLIERAEWSNFRHRALILEMRVTVANRTDTRKQLSGFQLQIHSGGQVAKGSDHVEVLQEVEHRKQQHNTLDRISVLDPQETVTGWMVYAFPWKTTPGEPEYTFSVIDELKNQYEAAKA